MPLGEGSPNAKILLVGESWGAEEERTQLPFQGMSGQELNKLLAEAGILRSECYTTNLVNARPPYNDLERWITWKKKDIQADMVQFRDAWVKPNVVEGYKSLCKEIDLIKPNIVVALGNYAMWALNGAKGIMKWRGSQLNVQSPPLLGVDLSYKPKLIPTVHPAYVMRDSSFWSMAVLDFKRVARERNTAEYSNVPKWNFIVRPSFEQVLETLRALYEAVQAGELEWLDFDLETRAGHIACAGISWTNSDAICIPFMCVEDIQGYWMEEQEAEIVWQLYRLLTHPRVKVRWQNGLYDAQYTYRHWHFVPRGAQDTMISHHSAFCGLPKSLAFQASMYCDHYLFWKDDGKTWAREMGEDQLWAYNGQDCVRTRECGEVEQKTLEKLNLTAIDEFQQKFFWPVLQCMQRGVAIDKQRRARLDGELQAEIAKREKWFVDVLGHPLNPASPPQMKKLFYEDLKQPQTFARAKKGKPGGLTLGKEALHKIWLKEPILRPLIETIQEIRSANIFLKNFIRAPLDVDGRMRTSYNICGTKTFRFASRKNAFDSGTNLQNIPKGEELDDDAEEEDEEGTELVDQRSTLRLPNIRKIFIPDPGYTIFDTDLSKADLRIVVWESGAEELKAMLREGRDPYIEMARECYRDPTINKTRPDGSDNPKYKTFKSFAHGTHYLGSPHGLAGRLGLTVHECDRLQKWYFSRNPAIRKWQEEFKLQVSKRRFVENIFGYKRFYFGKIDDAVFREAIAWVPQSTVALYINRIWMNVYEHCPQIQVLMQVHDSLVGQFPSHIEERCMAQLEEQSKIVLPYADPLIIPVGVKTSRVSWGECG